MKAVVRCDDVFDILTRGPFPAGSSDDQQVELHLRSCHSCRRLAEALRPAVDLIHESLTADEEATLPTYRGRVEKWRARTPNESDRGGSAISERPSWITPAWEAAAAEPSANVTRGIPLATSAASPVAHLIIGVLAGLAAVMVFWLGSLPSESARSGAGTAASQPVVVNTLLGTVTDVPDWTLLASLGLPLSCYPGSQSVAVAHHDLAAAAGSAESLCCTRCHFSGGEKLSSPRALHTLMVACAACHVTDSRVDPSMIGRFWRLPGRRTA